MSSPLDLIKQIELRYRLGVGVPLDILLSLLEKGHYQAATDTAVQIRGSLSSFEEELATMIDRLQPDPEAEQKTKTKKKDGPAPVAEEPVA